MCSHVSLGHALRWVTSKSKADGGEQVYIGAGILDSAPKNSRTMTHLRCFCKMLKQHFQLLALGAVAVVLMLGFAAEGCPWGIFQLVHTVDMLVYTLPSPACQHVTWQAGQTSSSSKTHICKQRFQQDNNMQTTWHRKPGRSGARELLMMKLLC